MTMKKMLEKFLPKYRASISIQHKKRLNPGRFNPLHAVEKTLDDFDRKPNLAPL